MTGERPRKLRQKDKRLFACGKRQTPGSYLAFGSTSGFPMSDARNLANIRSHPTRSLNYEPMFVQKREKRSRAAARAADLMDLMIEFATLGEYGLEYPEPVRETSRRISTPDPRLDLAGNTGRRATGPEKHRHGHRPCRPGRSRTDLPGWSGRPAHNVPDAQPGRRHKALADLDKPSRHRPTEALPEALRPPRIRLQTL